MPWSSLIILIDDLISSDLTIYPLVPEDNSGDDVDDEVRTLLTTDFEIGHYIRERIIPRAVLYFTGEGIEDEDEDYEEEEEEEDDDEEEEESDKDMKKENCKQQ